MDDPLFPERWPVHYIAFLVYVFAAVTGRLPVGTLAAAVGVAWVFFDRHPFTMPPFVRWLLAVIAWAALGIFTSDYPSLVQTSVVDLVKLAVVVVLAVNAVRTRGQVRFFLAFILACYLLYPIRGTVFLYSIGVTNFGRAIGVGIYENSNDLAALTVLVLSIALALVLGVRQRWLKVAGLAASGVMAVVIVLTQSRANMLGLFVFAGAMVATQKRKGRALLFAFAAGVIMAAAAPEGSFDRFTRLLSVLGDDGAASVSELDEEGSAEGRADIYRVAIRIGLDHPITGTGLSTYQYVHERYTEGNSSIVEQSQGRLDTHSTHLNIFAELGFPGLLIYTAMVLSLLLHVERTRRALKPVDPVAASQLGLLLAGYLAFLVAALVNTYTLLAMPYLQMGTLWVFARAYDPRGPDGKVRPPAGRGAGPGRPDSRGGPGDPRGPRGGRRPADRALPQERPGDALGPLPVVVPSD